jgi:hypothetical protein
MRCVQVSVQHAAIDAVMRFKTPDVMALNSRVQGTLYDRPFCPIAAAKTLMFSAPTDQLGGTVSKLSRGIPVAPPGA